MTTNEVPNDAQSDIAPTVKSLGFVSFFTDLGTEIVYPLLPLFLSGIGATPLFIGLIEGIAETIASGLKLVSGYYSDRIGKRKPLVLLGYGISGLTRPLLTLVTAPWHVLAVRALDRVGKGIRGAPRDALISDTTPAKNMGKAFGFQRAMDHAGAAFGPLVAFGLLEFVYNAPNPVPTDIYREIFSVATIPAILAVLIIVFFVRDSPQRIPVKRKELTLSSAGFPPLFRRFTLVAVLFALGNSSDAFLLLKAGQAGIPTAWIPVLWFALHLVKSVASYIGGSWSDRVGRKTAILLGWLVYAVIYAGFAVVDSAWQVWMLFSAYGIYFGLSEGVEKAFIADIIPAEKRGAAFGFFTVAIGLTALPASILTGFLWTNFSPSIAFLTGAGLATVATIFLLLIQFSAPQRVNVHD